ncbi:MAG: transposase [Terriglobales bacterium]
MVLDGVFGRFARFSPVTVMMRGILEYVFPASRLDELFRERAVHQYEDELLFSTVVNTLSLAVNGVRRSVNAAYLACREDFTVSVTALYDKLQGVEPQVAQALVRESSARLAPVIRKLRAQLPALLPGYCAKILDGNHLTGTEHRIRETRTLNSSPLPGQALVVLDPQLRLVLDVIPCEDAHAQERSLLGEVLPSFDAGDLAIADRNFCCTRFVFGLRDRNAALLIRQHASTLASKRLLGKRRRVGRCESGMVYEQALEIRNPHEPDPQKQVLCLRRITVVLDEPTRDGEKVIHLITTVPTDAADAITLAELYLRRWDIERAFQEIEQALRSEVDTLCYPKAALLAFCIALTTFNVLSTIKAAMRSAHHDPSLLFELSGYYLAEEISATYWGMVIAIEPRRWTRQFANITASELAACLLALAANASPSRFKKRKRGPKKPPPPRTGGLREKHVATKRLLDQRKLLTTSKC